MQHIMEFKKQYGQWTLWGNDEEYGCFNEGEDGERRFYEMRMGQYENPIIVADPALAFSVPSGVECVDANGEPAKPVEKIAGVICKVANRVIHRFNLTNLFASDVRIEEEGAVLVIQGVRWYLKGLFQKDANRVIGYDGFYYLNKPEAVTVKELADVDFRTTKPH